MYHNNPGTITLMRNDEMIIYVRKSHNILMFNLAVPDQIILAINKVMVIISQG